MHANPPSALRFLPAPRDSSAPHRRLVAALRGSRFGLLGLAVVIGVGAGLGAVVFRFLVEGITWLFTGSAAFGQQGRVGSAHLPWLGLAFLVLAPVIGGLLYGPLVHRFAPEARGHGVPEVMVAVAERGGRIRPQVALVKALASAITIGSGGSVGREGPIVQIGSALASGFGQWIRMPEHRLRILVACGAGGGIAATFNAPITGVFFGAEIILRELSAESLFALMIAAMVADAVAIPFLGDRPFLEDFPVHVSVGAPQDYLLIALLAVIAAFIGQGFSKLLYLVEDVCDRLWRGRPEWARPAVGGVLVGLLLLALPQMYGVGYPVMFGALDGRYALGFLLLLLVGKAVATSLTLGVGGSGGVFAPSLFIGLMAGTAFGVVVVHVIGPTAGSPVLYAAMGMAGVFSSSTRAPLTALASIVEMTGAFGLALPVLLTVGIATAVSRELGYGTIYTTKLLRRGQDLERTAPWAAFLRLTAGTTMEPLARTLPVTAPAAEPALSRLGTVVAEDRPQAVFENEPVAEALRQLDAYGRDGLPVIAADGSAVTGWMTTGSVLSAVRRTLSTDRGTATPLAAPDPLAGFDVAEVQVTERSPAAEQRAADVAWPDGAVPVAIGRPGAARALAPSTRIRAGDVLHLLVRRPATTADVEVAAAEAVRERAAATRPAAPARPRSS